ncbi:MAG: UPF0149 family protein [Lysobacter sp.]|nr:MAG: UPF0149 family protein [Lysobacter sp.]
MSSAIPTPDLPSLYDVEQALRARRLGVSGPELHGALCGWLAGGGAVTGWLARVLADDSVTAPTAGDALDRLRAAAEAQLGDSDFGFELLVPEADASLVERSGALFEWCRGFLGGFGLAAGDRAELSDEGREALEDLAKLAAASPQDDGDEDDETALAEIEEFVRVAALLLHGDCNLGARRRQRLH